MKISFTVLKILSGHYFQTENYRGTLCGENASGVMVLILCTLSDRALYLYQVSRKYISKGLRLI